MICEICKLQESKYKCPKCKLPYCSIACYKSELHQHEEIKIDQKQEEQTQESKEEISRPSEESKFDKILSDPQIQYYLKQQSLQFHLLSILTILKDGFINNLNTDQKIEVMNLKLNDLRKGGIEENELIEEFVQRVLELNEIY
ncbi:HIT1 [Candida pseudojiufengensis]|uniref:HIT1 n=1 Tax=Candida pseudojiufengensis TaxID=497109 RepID=UPI0022250428|nr:HIT1 [Candida pseudojiufengensis]KAI5965712.1 HIT1 [Candida pseudojiufengensis]